MNNNGSTTFYNFRASHVLCEFYYCDGPNPDKTLSDGLNTTTKKYIMLVKSVGWKVDYDNSVGGHGETTHSCVHLCFCVFAVVRRELINLGNC